MIRTVRALLVVGMVFLRPDLLCARQQAEEFYTAELKPLNRETAGRAAAGRAEFRIKDDTMEISITAEGLAPATMHLQHYHGFPDGRDAVCPTKQQDVNGDSVIDLLETEKTSGTTLVPFHDHPAGLAIKTDTYPVASSDGAVRYRKTVSLSKLNAAVREKYGISDVRLENMVVFLHGVDPSTGIPQSVRSLPGVPAHVTLPVACGEIKKEK